MSDQKPHFLGGLPGSPETSSQPVNQSPPTYDAGSVPHAPVPAVSGQPGSGGGGGATPPQANTTNTLAVVSLISSFFISLAGIITGHIALKQIKRTGQKGRGMALAGTIIGYVGIVFGIIAVIIAFAVGSAAVSLSTTLSSGPGSGYEIEYFDEGEVGIEDGEEVDAEIGGSVAGYELSAEFCDALTAFETVSLPDTDGNVPAETLAAFEGLAAIESPNQQIYADFAELLKDPASVDETTASSAFDEVFEAFQMDYIVCA